MSFGVHIYVQVWVQGEVNMESGKESIGDSFSSYLYNFWRSNVLIAKIKIYIFLRFHHLIDPNSTTSW